MKAVEIRNMTKEEMLKKLEELQDELFRLRVRHVTEELPNPLRLRMLRRDIARIKTILRELELRNDREYSGSQKVTFSPKSNKH
jgi:large subunit ribosomal protein L29